MEYKWSRRFFKALFCMIMSLMFRMRFRGREHIPDTGPAIVCANHISHYDIPILIFASKRWIYYMAKKELFRKWLGRTFITAMGGFPVDREKGDIVSIRKAVHHLEQGKLLGIFPQGSRERKGTTLPPRKGAAMLAAMSEAPIVPVLIEGSYKLFSTVTVTIGEPFHLNLMKNVKYPAEIIQEKSREVMDRIYALRGKKA